MSKSPEAPVTPIVPDLQFIGWQIAEQTFSDGEGAAKLLDYLQGAAYAIGFSIWKEGSASRGQMHYVVETIAQAGKARWVELTMDPAFIAFLSADPEGRA